LSTALPQRAEWRAGATYTTEAGGAAPPGRVEATINDRMLRLRRLLAGIVPLALPAAAAAHPPQLLRRCMPPLQGL
jgi:hypothetical protein